MNNIKKISLASVLALSSIAANAELISTDWKTQGDGLATLDSISGIEWLDLTQTAGLTMASMDDRLSNEFVGWRLPTFDEYQVLLINTFSSVENVSDLKNNSVLADNEALDWRAHFGTSDDRGNSGYNWGWINAGDEDLRLTGIVNNTLQSNNINYYSSHYVQGYHPAGVFLVSDGGVTLSSINDPSINIVESVPLPATLGLLGLAMAGLSFRRKSA